MKIVIATGIFPPEVGGPATYAEHLGRQFALAGHDVTVVTYADRGAKPDAYPFMLVRVLRGNRVLNRVRYFVRMVVAARGADIVYVLDWFAAGFPAASAALLLRAPYIVRVGGDYCWEQQYLPSGAGPLPLRAFYDDGIYARLYRGSVADRLIRFVLWYARHVVFNSDVQRNLYTRYLGLREENTLTVWNPLPQRSVVHIRRGEPSHEFVYWGRLIVMKNVDSLMQAFARAKLPRGYSLTIIGDGPELPRLEALRQELGLDHRVVLLPGMPRETVLERVKNARAFVLPSWTDIAPNQVAEALAVGIPCIVTSETFLPPGIRKAIKRFIDPSSADDIARALEEFSDDETYRQFSSYPGVDDDASDWDFVAARYLALAR